MLPEPPAFRADLVRRLRCAEAHLDAVAGMIDNGDDCQAILRQTLAVQGTLRKISRRLVKHYLNDRLPADLQALDPAVRERALESVTRLYELVSQES